VEERHIKSGRLSFSVTDSFSSLRWQIFFGYLSLLVILGVLHLLYICLNKYMFCADLSAIK
jgi:hypothetical protein